jgi:hypothetical protein
MFKVPEKYRVIDGDNSTTIHNGNNGLFKLYLRGNRTNLGSMLYITATEKDSWECVEVYTPVRYPIWEELCLVRNLFWDRNDLVIQYYPREKDCSNFKKYSVCLWRPTNQLIPNPQGALK